MYIYYIMFMTVYIPQDASHLWQNGSGPGPVLTDSARASTSWVSNQLTIFTSPCTVFQGWDPGIINL